MPPKRQRNAKDAAAKVAVATTQEEAAKSDVRSPDPKSKEAELKMIDQVREDGVRLTVRPVPGATSQWISWRYAPFGTPWGDWQAPVLDSTGKADQLYVPFRHSDDTCYEFHRGYSNKEGGHFLGAVELTNRDAKIEERGGIGTGVIGPGAKHTMVEQKQRQEHSRKI